MIVIGIDPHKQTHTAVAVQARSGELRAERTVKARTKGHGQLLLWARTLDDERVFALEDCRHVSGSLERFLLARGERVVRVPPKLMGRARRAGRSYGKSDAIDALAVARAYLREPKLPVAFLAGAERDVKLLLDHREDLVCERSRIQQRLRWHLHDLEPDFEIPAGALDRYCWLERVDARLGTHAESVQVSICRELVLRCHELTRRANELERELERLVAEQAAPLLGLSGCAALTAAKLLTEAANVGRFGDDAAFAMYGGVGPLDASSGQQRRHRLNRFGNRQLNCALHRIAVTQGRSHEPARSYLARKQAEGKSRREALRCLKRHLARTIYSILRQLEETDMNTVERPVLTPALT